jgi:LPXTG-motif cell wall-anchored protein
MTCSRAPQTPLVLLLLAAKAGPANTTGCSANISGTGTDTMVIAIIVAVVASVVVLLGGLFFLWRRRQRSNSASSSDVCPTPGKALPQQHPSQQPGQHGPGAAYHGEYSVSPAPNQLRSH